ncbi:iron ABC transporter permease [Paenibacillus sp. CF384]|uniref:FecCD family ABC transporter permease n=1 Tax=Paenibacillus sp. CF384 TaxID=1884382 RepID=UPI000897F4CD|nr:iron ABC transporter permease [Paenibacillus sp. CF384]SDX70657.1 iron complex transport system permease protein [Paenibacillus sp. CF384]
MREIVLSSAEKRMHKRNLIVAGSFGLGIIIVFILSMNTGFIRLTPMELIHTILGNGTAQQELILFDFRLPRIVLSILVGTGLAISGSIMQAISRNGLADPGILGVNSGAGLAVLLFVVYFPVAANAPVYLLPVLAWVGSALTAAIVFLLAYRRNTGISSTRLLLSGIAVTAGISSVTIVLSLRISKEKFMFIQTWLAGSIWGKDWQFVLALLPFIAILLPYVFYKARTLNILNLGDSMATGLGAFVSREQILLLAAAVGLAGSCVAVSGSIGFVGLIAPHLARRLVGSRHQAMLPVTALVGGLLIITADTIARWAFMPSEIPTGIVVAVIGSPYFLFLLVRSKA